jgi:hypothetical protein
MKKYKTWEVIKAMTENKDLRFKYNTGYETGEIAVVRSDIRVVKCDGKPIDTHFELHTGFIGIEWELIQQPITFMEAVKAYSEGKTIRCEIGEEARVYDYKVGYGMTNIDHYAITVGEILNGKWYVEVPNE